MQRPLLSILIALGASACVSTAGPFVTNIRLAAPGTLLVSKCEVQYSNWGNGQIDTGTCFTETLYILPSGPPGAPRTEASPARTSAAVTIQAAP
jgi:hypothetical protein